MHPDIRERCLSKIAAITCAYPWPVIAACVALAVVSLVISERWLGFDADLYDLTVPAGSISGGPAKAGLREQGLGALIVLIRVAPDFTQSKRFADTLARRLNNDHADVKSVFYRIDPDKLGNALLYLKRTQLSAVHARMRNYQGPLLGYAADPNLETFFAIVNREADRLMLPEGAARTPDSIALRRPADESAGFNLVDAVLRGMLSARPDHPPWGALFGVNQPTMFRDGYLTTAKGDYLLMRIAWAGGDPNRAGATDAVQLMVDRTRAEFPGVEAGLTGAPALVRSQTKAIGRDMLVATIVAIAANMLLIMIPFGAVVEPLFVLAALSCGIAWSFGCVTLTIGTLNPLSAAFTSVLAAIGINFTIHLMARYDEARSLGRPVNEAVRLSLVNTGRGVFASMNVIAIAFLMMVFTGLTGFNALAELGIASAAGLLLCFIAAVLVFPALVVIRDRDRPAQSIATSDEIRPAMSRGLATLIAVGITAFTLVAIGYANRVSFDDNLLKLQPLGSEAAKYESIWFEESGRPARPAIAFANTQPEADRLAAAFRRLPEVGSVETISTYVPDDQAEKITEIKLIAAQLAAVDVNLNAKPSDPRVLSMRLARLHRRLRRAEAFDSSPALKETDGLIRAALLRLITNPHFFLPYEAAMAADFAWRVAQFRRSFQPRQISADTLPPALRERFIAADGSYMVRIYPNGKVWRGTSLASLVTALRRVDPNVRGVLVRAYIHASIVRRGYERGAILGLAIILLLVLLDFRSMRDTMLAAVPLIFGVAWLLEMMGMFGWQFNLINMGALSIVGGTAIDSGVNLVYRWRESGHRPNVLTTTAIGKSVIVSCLTTIAGFAALMLTSSLASLGLVLAAGVSLVLLATLVVLPALLRILPVPLTPAEIDQCRSASDANSE